ncbi:hypothetical protein DFQ12_4271 [Sphingobacterium detergens]|uniref:Uncharacterized protein n=1 Tax=Sphingobacterium detergens TaxID=1145106 RepID=A0A420ARR3_SPHD1|nr:hypothetical protein DFQ12_4271 [Sphingobacterium detergens]
MARLTSYSYLFQMLFLLKALRQYLEDLSPLIHFLYLRKRLTDRQFLW